MRFDIKGVRYDATNIVDAPIDLLFELNRQTRDDKFPEGMEGQDILDGLAEFKDMEAGRAPSLRLLMAMAGLVWLGKRRAGEMVDYEEAVKGLSLMDIEFVGEPSVSTEVTPDPPTQPGSVPAIVVEPTPRLDTPSPGLPCPTPSSSTASPSATSGPE